MHIYVVPATGGALKEVSHGTRDEAFPNWSRDGASLFFGNYGGTVGGIPAVYRLDLKSNQLATLVGSEGMIYPRLSPDDKYIAALTSTRHLTLFDQKTQKWTELTQIGANHPRWSHDAKYVYFNSTAEGEAAFYRVRIADGTLERAASLKDVKRPVSKLRRLDRTRPR
jgi:Tol biopolymer transport system component